MRTFRSKNVTCSHWYYLEGGGREEPWCYWEAEEGSGDSVYKPELHPRKMSQTLFIAFYYGRRFMTEKSPVFFLPHGYFLSRKKCNLKD